MNALQNYQQEMCFAVESAATKVCVDRFQHHGSYTRADSQCAVRRSMKVMIWTESLPVPALTVLKS